MAGKRIQTYYLSDDVVDGLQALVLTVTQDIEAARRLGLAPKNDAFTLDERGLTPADYLQLQKITDTEMQGVALIEFAWTRATNKQAARRYYKKALRDNQRRAKALSTTPEVSTSRMVEALLRLALETVTVNAPAKSSSRKGRNVRKAA